MSANMTVTGNIAEPNLRTTSGGKEVCDLSIGCTHRQKNKQTGQWEDVGQPLWIKASFWDEDAALVSQLTKGSKVTVSGTLVVEQYQKRDGSQGETLRLHFPRYLGSIPKRVHGGGSHATQAPVAQGTFQQPTSDPWATQEQPHFPISQGAPAVDQPPF